MSEIIKNGDQRGSKTSILQALRMQGPLSRIKLTALTQLSRATISVSIAELIEANLVQETEKAPSTGGRPAVFLEMVPGSHVIIAADLDNQTWTLGAFDLIGNVVHTAKYPVSNSTPEAAMKELSAAIERFVLDLDTSISIIPLLGLSVPGLVDTNRGIIRSASDLGWNTVNIEKMMNAELGWPTIAINRHRARGLAECRYGSGRDYNQMIYVGIGTGIAAGMFADRQLISGSLGGAGELGHVTIEPDGPLCQCGNHGCLQMLSATPAIEQEARKIIRIGDKESVLLQSLPGNDLQLLHAEQICVAADLGDELALQVIDKAATYLGIALANLVNLFNPEAIILGGPIPRMCSSYVQTATKVMYQRAMSVLSAQTVIKTATFKEIGGALGAANFALDKHLSLANLQYKKSL